MNGEQHDFSNLETFCEWLIHRRHQHYTVLAHYGKGYDFQFIMNHCITQNIRHKSIYNGSKIMYLEIQHGLHLRFVDSFNFMTMPLKNMPATFGLCELKKGYFAHLFNTKSIKTIVEPCHRYRLPMEAMSETEQSTFRLWYKQQKIYQSKLHYWKHVLVNIDKNERACGIRSQEGATSILHLRCGYFATCMSLLSKAVFGGCWL